MQAATGAQKEDSQANHEESKKDFWRKHMQAVSKQPQLTKDCLGELNEESSLQYLEQATQSVKASVSSDLKWG